MDIEKRLEAEQHKKLKELQEKLSEVLDYEPADSGDENEDESRGSRSPWRRTRYKRCPERP